MSFFLLGVQQHLSTTPDGRGLKLTWLNVLRRHSLVAVLLPSKISWNWCIYIYLHCQISSPYLIVVRPHYPLEESPHLLEKMLPEYDPKSLFFPCPTL